MSASAALRWSSSCPAIPHIDYWCRDCRNSLSPNCGRGWTRRGCRWINTDNETTLRSLREISFRLQQELMNGYQFLRPPELLLDPGFQARIKLPDPVAVSNGLGETAFAREVIALAEQIRKHRFPILGLTIETGPKIPWRRDHISGVETGLGYFRRIPYLNTRLCGDHKVIWEPNRHQHLVVLAQAFLFTGDAGYLEEIRAQLESWFVANPYNRGINWASALEVAFRALSWIWMYHLAGEKMIAEF